MPEARARFTAVDIKDYAEGVSIDDAEEWLVNNYKPIEDAMVRAGWNAIETLDNMDPIRDYA